MGGGHRLLIFSQFTSMLELIRPVLEAANIAYHYLDGSTPAQERLRLANSFNHGEKEVFLISLKAGGTGLNLVGADVIIHYDPWWNEAAQNQATDRAHRIGQTKNVLVYKLIVKDTIEERILKMQEQKSKLADDILSGKGMQSGIIDKDDLMNLL